MQAVDVFPGGLGARECPDLVALCQREGPFVSCYFDTEASTEDANHRLEIRWKDVRRELEAQGAYAAAIGAIETAVGTARRLGEAVGIFASGGDVVLVEPGQSPLGFDAGVCGPLPALGPVLRWRQRSVPYITVACDRAGADIAAFAQGGVEQLVTSAGEEDRHDPELHKVRVGGWSQGRYQQRVENAWDRNAKAVIAALDELVAKIKPRALLYGGDPHACSLLAENASSVTRDLLQQLTLSRAADGSDAHDMREVARAVATVVAAETARLLAHWKEMKSKEMGIEGAKNVLAALSASAVETLLIHDDLADLRSGHLQTAYYSTDPMVFGTQRAAVTDIAPQADEARLADVAICGAFLTGASVRIVPGSTARDGMGALLRFPCPS